MAANAITDALAREKAAGQIAVVGEIKAEGGDGFDLLLGREPADIAASYARGGAAAISVVTGKWLGGSVRLLEAVASANLGLPILRRDFIRNVWAVRQSRDLGASAVVLTRQLLDAERFRELVAAAREEGLEPFVEVGTLDELGDVTQIYQGVVGVAETIDPRELGMLLDSPHHLWVSTRDVGQVAEVGALAAAGFDGVVVGTHLLSAADPEAATAELVASAARWRG